jgi:hypothetical protein
MALFGPLVHSGGFGNGEDETKRTLGGMGSVAGMTQTLYTNGPLTAEFVAETGNTSGGALGRLPELGAPRSWTTC